MDALKDYSYDVFDSQRKNFGTTVTMILPDLTIKQNQSQELKDRLKYNAIVDPVVSALRFLYGKNYKIVEVDKNNDGETVASIVLDEDGEYCLVPSGNDPEVFLKCNFTAEALLRLELNKMGMDIEEKQDEVICKILKNRFYEDVEPGDSDNLGKICALCILEAMEGYNYVEVRQKKKNKKGDEEVDESVNTILSSFQNEAKKKGYGTVPVLDATGNKKDEK